MPVGPGRYDQETTRVRESLQAAGVILIVIEGKHGSGFSCQAPAGTVLTVPELLEDVARKIRGDLVGPESQ